MPFLIPACVALAADGLIVYLHRSLLRDEASHSDTLPEESQERAIYKVGYLALLAWFRILVLLLPLLFHSYTGTALACHVVYMGWYTMTLIVVVTHMLALCLVNPESMEALVPEPEGFLADLHLYRRLWYTLILSVVAHACHFVLVQHVKSTAPPNASNGWYHPSTGSGSTTPPVSLYFAIRANPVLQDEPALVHAVGEFVVDLQARLQRTKQEWTKRLEDFTLKYNQRRSASATGRSALSDNRPFTVLLRLFAYQDVLENGQLDEVFALDGGRSVTYLVPQLLSFLLHGASSQCSKQLEDWILTTCSHHVYFAHRCLWFLRAWCLEQPAQPSASLSRTNSEGQLSRRSSLASSTHTGGLVPFLDEPAQMDYNVTNGCGGDSATRLLAATPDDKFLPEERLVMEGLMHRVQECGQIAASRLALGSGDEPDDGYHEDSMLLDRQAALPIHPDTHVVSSAHLQAVRAPRRYGFLPLSIAQEARWDRRATEAFDQAPCFWDALIHLADSLFEVPVANRKTVLRHELKALECEVLPNNAVYVPLHHVPHRVWRLVADESIPLGTKERVPCIVILEVVQMTDPDVVFHSTSLPVGSHTNGSGPYRRRRSSWVTLLGRLPQHLGGPGQGGNEEMAEDEEVELDEMDLVHEWQHKYRQPLRRLPFISKVADSMKDGLSRVRSSVRERLERDRTVSDELQALTLAESLVSSESMPLEIDQTPIKTPVKDTTESRSANLSRGNSGNSLESMGQWVTPQPSKPAVSARIDLVGVRRRMDRDSRPDSPSGGLVYGSDHDEEKGFESIMVPSLARKEEEIPTPIKGSKKEKSRPPPVVFRESWQAKQERVRRTSAYGRHPGWRLLPVLIKANDDLRQEQMAAQLIYKMASILARENCPVWLCPYEILALTDRGGIIEAIPDTISLDSLKRNDSGFTSLRDFFHSYYGEDTSALASAKANFVESLAAYSMVCFLLQIKDRHNGNILLDSRGHMIHIDFGFFFLSSPGKNAGFESAPFKLTREFVEVLDGTQSHLFHVFRELCVRSFLALRKHCMEIILLVEMLKTGNEELQCFRGRPDEAVRQLRERFRLDLNDRACREYVHSLIDASTENWRTDWYDRYQRYFVGVL